MSFLSWFGKRKTATESASVPPSDLGATDATLPLQYQSTDKAAPSNSRKSERMQRRELLYGVVRECMTASGILSSTYKFKVLSLDSSGRQYLIMVDVPREYMTDPERFLNMEGAIARSAKERFEMLVTAVYWRVNDMVSVRPASKPIAQAAPASKVATKPVTSAGVASPATQPRRRSSDEEVSVDEVLAFKRAVAAAASGAAPARSGEVVRSGRRHPVPESDFSDTEPFDANSPLGPSQFGGLN
jgi:hypothetical protein